VRPLFISSRDRRSGRHLTELDAASVTRLDAVRLAEPTAHGRRYAPALDGFTPEASNTELFLG
jgi:hypothetical protein